MYSCVSVETIANRIKEENPDLKEVKVRENKPVPGYLNIDLITAKGGNVSLVMVSPNLEAPFRLTKIGGYTFEAYYQYADASNNYRLDCVPIQLIGQEIGVSLVTIHDVIRHYDAIYAWVNSLRSAKEEMILSEKEKHGDDRFWIWYSDIDFKKIAYSGYDGLYGYTDRKQRDYFYFIFKDDAER
jgi:hypothetical protein